jgi:hypothetical protein
MADKKRDILEFFEQMNFEQMIPTHKNNINKRYKKYLRPNKYQNALG